MNGRLKEYHEAIAGTFADGHSANQRTAMHVSDGEKLLEISEARRMRKQLERI